MEIHREISVPAYEELDRNLHLYFGGGSLRKRRGLKRAKRRAERRFVKLMLAMGFEPDFKSKPRGWAS